MIAVDDLRSCENCGNVFLKSRRQDNKPMHCMQCVEEGNPPPMMLDTYSYLKKLLHRFLHHNVEEKHHWWNEQ